MDSRDPSLSLGTPSPEAQSWGALMSIVVIVLMITIGAFYSWSKRIAETKVPAATVTAQ